MTDLLTPDQTSQHSMTREQADAALRRVRYHLERGSIEFAHRALDDAWQTHCDAIDGPAELVDQPLASVREIDLRVLGFLERSGVDTVGALMALNIFELQEITGIGAVAAVKLDQLAREFRQKANK